MNRQEVLTIRQQSQGLYGSDFNNPADVLSWMGALQAQHFSMAKWGIGVRLPGSTASQIEAALNQGHILRTHILRPTWHLVRAEDLLWMLKLTAPNVQRLLNTSCKSFAITSKELLKAERIFQKLLQQDNAACLKREDLLAGLQAHKIVADRERGAFFLMHSELAGLICSGPDNGKQSSYVLVEKRLGHRLNAAVANANGLSKEEALAKLARLYFQSRGPASLTDFKWWSGLSLVEARMALSAISAELEMIKGEQPCYFLRPARTIPKAQNLYQFLPSFDEYLISYRDRSAAIDLAHHPIAFTKNGVFKPVLLFNGRVIGTWEKKEMPNKTTSVQGAGFCITVCLFEKVDKHLHDLVLTALEDYRQFLEIATPLDKSQLKIMTVLSKK